MNIKCVFLCFSLLCVLSIDTLLAQGKRSSISTPLHNYFINELGARDSTAIITLEIYNKTKKLVQKDTVENIMDHPKAFHEVVISDEVDWNFDGKNDVIMTIHYDFLKKESAIFAFLSDKIEQKFTLNTSFTNFLNHLNDGSHMVLHNDRKLLRYIEVTRKDYKKYSDYRFKKGELIIVRSVVEDAETDKLFVTVIQKELVNDVWKESTRKVPYKTYKWTE